MTLVADASLIVAALIDAGPDGEWADELLGTEHLAAPHLMPVEVTNVLRRAVLAGELVAEVATLALADLADLTIDLYDFAPFSERVWELHPNVTSYDAWYVAIAEALAAPLATLDQRLSRAPGPTCEFRTPPH